MNTPTRFAMSALPAPVSGVCAPEVGSEEWCAKLKAKPKGHWIINEATDYAKRCIFK